MGIILHEQKSEGDKMDKSKILVCKTKDKIIICYDGKKLIKDINGFENMTKEEIKEWFIKEKQG